MIALVNFAAMAGVWGIWWLSFRFRAIDPHPAPARPVKTQQKIQNFGSRHFMVRVLAMLVVLGLVGMMAWHFASRSASMEGQNLAGESLQNADFANGDLAGANLSGARLQGADLTSANLQNANLAGAQLEGADLNHANLERANLTGAHLENADLNGADLYAAKLIDAELENANLNGTHLDSADLTGAQVDQDELNQACGAFTRLDYGLTIPNC
jgi:hypothetical protein